MEESLYEYIRSVFKRWWSLVVDLAGGAIFINGLLNKTVSISIPIGLAIIFLGLSIAQFLAFHDLRKVSKQQSEELKEAKRYDVKKQRIEIVKEAKWPVEIPRILDDMRKCLSGIVEASDDCQNVTSEKIYESCGGTPQDLYKAINQKIIDDNVRVTFTFYRNFKTDIGLAALQEKNTKWKELLEEFETVKKDIPDQDLMMYVMSHFEALNGVYAINLFYRYMAKHGANEVTVSAVKPFRPVFELLSQTMTRVTKRILELKLGEEPKWEMLYFKGEK